MGIPVVGLMESDLVGMRRIESVDSTEMMKGVKDVISSYPQYVLGCKEQRELISWEVIVSRMLMDYASFGKISQKDLILNDYKSVSKKVRKNRRQWILLLVQKESTFLQRIIPRVRRTIYIL